MRYTRFKYFAFLIQFFLFHTHSFAQTDSLNAIQFYQQAEAFLLKGKPNKAIKFFRRATVVNVTKYLRINGINSKELITFGQGEYNQFDKKRLNRRVEIGFQ